MELGQHFLCDLAIANDIVDALGVEGGQQQQSVLEVGPGMGVLTQFLLQRGDVDLRVVEIDTQSVQYLREHYPQQLEGRIIEGDFLQLPLGPENTAVIGNFPYNISTQIFFHILEYRDSVPCVVGMLQKEVARRLAAPAGTREGGVLSIFLQVYYTVEYLFDVGPEKFSPPPKVQSGVIRCTRNDVTELGCCEKLFRRVVKGAFSQRRKMLRNALYATFPPLRERKIDHPFFGLRAENLTIPQFIELTNFIEQQL